LLVLAVHIPATLGQNQPGSSARPAASSVPAQNPRATPVSGTPFDSLILANASQMIDEGRQTFRFDTFGDETFWGDQLQLHKALAGAKLGGVGPGVSPKAALAVGLKVDADALPVSITQELQQNQLNLDDPATTAALLKLNAVVGLTGFFDAQGG